MAHSPVEKLFHSVAMGKAPPSVSKPSKKVKAIGVIDFFLTMATIVLVGYRVILPLAPTDEGGVLQATQSPHKFRIREWEERANRPVLNSFEFGFVVGLFVIIGVMGTSWSLVLIKVAIFPDIRSQIRVQLLGFWLLCNAIVVGLMIYLGVWLFQNGPKDNEDDEALYSTQIPFLICFMFRLILVFMIWKERIRMLDERRMSNEEIDKWLRYLAGYKPPIRQGHHV